MHLIMNGLELEVPIMMVEYEEEGETIPEIKELLPRGQNIEHIMREGKTSDHDTAFSDVRVQPWLDDRKVNALLIGGINAGACVLSTIYSARNRRLKVATSRDLIGSPGDYELLSWITDLIEIYGAAVEDSHVKLIERLEKSKSQGLPKFFTELTINPF